MIVLLLTIVISRNVLRSLKKFAYFFFSLSLLSIIVWNHVVMLRENRVWNFVSFNQKKSIMLFLTILFLIISRNVTVTFWEVWRNLFTFLSLSLSLVNNLKSHYNVERRVIEKDYNLILIDKKNFGTLYLLIKKNWSCYF